MSDITRAVDELNSIAADIRNAGAKAAVRGSQLVRKTAFDIEATAKTLSPVDTGLMRSTIGSDFYDGGLTAVIGPTVDYAEWVEYGTSRMAPHAFMGPAADRHFPDFVDGAADIGGDIL